MLKKTVLIIVIAVLLVALLFGLAVRSSAYVARLLIYEGMTVKTITMITGSKGHSLGLGIIMYEWDFPDGSTLTVWLGKPFSGADNIDEFYAAEI